MEMGWDFGFEGDSWLQRILANGEIERGMIEVVFVG